ncbi:cyanoexosortase A system-associated protein [Chamaesiphon sp. VAR_69_metabat_338]|uniref:cyanoexosortase A system-associated protein n=1 Tax=Chamaesiphon sp. VAR_69_metabat_338 TaxID=2964704 RepID=UPI00286E6043|nr:cyanoexosortase A system-associated protein [Chamaesiphon sp. VAR_69_metabat_338]
MTISVARLARQSLLCLLCGGAVGVLAHNLINSPAKSSLQAPATFNFPDRVPLSDTSMLASKPLAAHTFGNGMVATGRSYRYALTTATASDKPQAIEVEIRYMTDGVANRPTMDALLPVFTKMPIAALAPATMKEKPGVGFYNLFVDNKTAYFGTCINPQGITTVTGDQFHANSNPNPLTSGIPLQRFLPWLMGKQTFRDSRCLWTLLSTPIDPNQPDATVKTLETTGVNWIRWWQMHFPAA